MSDFKNDIVNNVQVDQRKNDFDVIKRHIKDMIGVSHTITELHYILDNMKLTIEKESFSDIQDGQREETKQGHTERSTFYLYASYNIDRSIDIEIDYMLDRNNDIYIISIDTDELI